MVEHDNWIRGKGVKIGFPLVERHLLPLWFSWTL